MSSPFVLRDSADGWEPVKLDSFATPPPPERDRGSGHAQEALRARAREEGHAAGYREGREQARQEALRLAAVAEAAAAAAGHSEAALAEEVLDLALELARQMVRSELKVRREALLPVVREALQCLPNAAPAPQLALNPGDVDVVRAHIGDELAAIGCRVVEDHRVAPGGCRIVSPACEVDATLPTRWKRLLAALGRDHGWLEP